MFFSAKPKTPPLDYPYTCQQASPTTQSKFKHEYNKASFTCVKWGAGGPETKARVLIVHGFGEHTQLYARFMDQLSSVGVESFVYDQRGSGETAGTRARGLTNEFHTFDDLDHFIDWNLHDKASQVPLFLFGHSMGGGISLNYGCDGKFRDQIAGIMVTGPLILMHRHSAPSAVVDFLSPLLAAALPGLRIDTALDIDATTSDPAFREYLEHDPLTVPLLGSLRQIYDFLSRGKRLVRDKQRTARFQTPVLLMHGERDQITDPAGSRQFYELCGSRDKTIKTYKDACHSLCLERDETFQRMSTDATEWLRARCDGDVAET
ncbi:LAMI_0G04060g1_1 [Lachancea mirantina]|uniref:LAMI_0G04060g1_1 n=1 Tax=Lachancea mirantina TaxID=1230905 RepID=A0A1G4K8D9_9SACH|nr:LAMI_0G04060g1_1 [Lachancea mirantina]